MKTKLSSWFKAIEVVLLVVGALMILMMVMPFSDMHNFGSMVREAKKENIYYDGPKETQVYFGNKLKVEGVIYDDEELLVMVKGCRFGPYGKLPQRGYIKTMEGEEIGWSGAGSSSTVFCSSGYFAYENVPAGLTQVEFTNEAYGESFSFVLDLERGDER